MLGHVTEDATANVLDANRRLVPHEESESVRAPPGEQRRHSRKDNDIAVFAAMFGDDDESDEDEEVSRPSRKRTRGRGIHVDEDADQDEPIARSQHPKRRRGENGQTVFDDDCDEDDSGDAPIPVPTFIKPVWGNDGENIADCDYCFLCSAGLSTMNDVHRCIVNQLKFLITNDLTSHKISTLCGNVQRYYKEHVLTNESFKSLNLKPWSVRSIFQHYFGHAATPACTLKLHLTTMQEHLTRMTSHGCYTRTENDPTIVPVLRGLTTSAGLMAKISKWLSDLKAAAPEEAREAEERIKHSVKDRQTRKMVTRPVASAYGYVDP